MRAMLHVMSGFQHQMPGV